MLRPCPSLIIKLRKERGLTREELAKHINIQIDTRTLGNWEKGLNGADFHLNKLRRLAQFHQMDYTELLEEYVPVRPTTQAPA